MTAKVCNDMWPLSVTHGGTSRNTLFWTMSLHMNDRPSWTPVCSDWPYIDRHYPPFVWPGMWRGPRSIINTSQRHHCANLFSHASFSFSAFRPSMSTSTHSCPFELQRPRSWHLPNE